MPNDFIFISLDITVNIDLLELLHPKFRCSRHVQKLN
jgi:hypothetical protein